MPEAERGRLPSFGFSQVLQGLLLSLSSVTWGSLPELHPCNGCLVLRGGRGLRVPVSSLPPVCWSLLRPPGTVMAEHAGGSPVRTEACAGVSPCARRWAAERLAGRSSVRGTPPVWKQGVSVLHLDACSLRKSQSRRSHQPCGQARFLLTGRQI